MTERTIDPLKEVVWGTIDPLREAVWSTIDLLWEARKLLEAGEPLPVDLVIKLRERNVDPDRLASNYNL